VLVAIDPWTKMGAYLLQVVMRPLHLQHESRLGCDAH
jgi:hypothetical protein